MSNAWQVLDATEQHRIEALPFVQRLTMSDPPYFYMNMLSCCTSLVEKGHMHPNVIPWLMTQTVRAINDALQDPQTMLSIGVILSVGRIALREVMRGNRHVGATIHRPAQARMLAMVGGLDSLAVPALVREHILWADRLMTRQTGISMTDINPDAIKQANDMTVNAKDDLVLQTYYLEGIEHDPRHRQHSG